MLARATHENKVVYLKHKDKQYLLLTKHGGSGLGCGFGVWW
jgi:hypothetical protein